MHDTIIIGAGPAGLATASSLSSQGMTDFVLIERGKPLAARQRERTQDISSGVGGAGLYSDGKFSFFPSATWLWKNLSAEHLQHSYEWLQSVLKQYNVTAPDFNNRTTVSPIIDERFKAYPSFYIDFNNRFEMINQWSQDFSRNTLTNTMVVDFSKQKNIYCVKTNNETIFAKNIVIATGRMGPLQFLTFTLPLKQLFQRIEVGVRLKGVYTHPFFKELQQYGQCLDPKFILTHPEHPAVSWRTFCFCHRGEIMNSGDEEYVALSGRADCAATNESNIGFNTRIKIPSLRHLLPKSSKSFTLNLAEVYENERLLEHYFNPFIARYIALGLTELKQHFPSLENANALEIVGPTLEGVGDYPVVDNQLKTNHQGIYVAGDSLGLFRGLTAALLSGHYIGQQIMANSHYDEMSAVNL